MCLKLLYNFYAQSQFSTQPHLLNQYKAVPKFHGARGEGSCLLSNSSVCKKISFAMRWRALEISEFLKQIQNPCPYDLHMHKFVHIVPNAQNQGPVLYSHSGAHVYFPDASWPQSDSPLGSALEWTWGAPGGGPVLKGTSAQQPQPPLRPIQIKERLHQKGLMVCFCWSFPAGAVPGHSSGCSNCQRSVLGVLTVIEVDIRHLDDLPAEQSRDKLSGHSWSLLPNCSI